MSLFGSLAGGFKALAGPIARIANNPIVQIGASLIPGGGLVAKGLGLAASAATVYGGYKALTGGFGNSGIAGAMPTGGLPALPGAAGVTQTTTTMPMPMPGGGTSLKTVHINPLFPQDKASLDSWIAAGLLVPFNQLHTAYRAPRGFRVCHVNGTTMAVRNDIARKMHLVKPTHKPPISVGEYHSLKRAHRTIKKVHKIHGLIKYVSEHTSTGGKVIIHKKHHKKGHG